MKVLTVKQPWASLIVEGYKEYEFRSWKTNYRGKILIHAGKSFDKSRLEDFKDYDLNYDFGAIIGEAELVDCILIDDNFDRKLHDKNRLVYGNHTRVGIYAWKLENVKKYEEKEYVKGKLGLWDY